MYHRQSFSRMSRTITAALIATAIALQTRLSPEDLKESELAEKIAAASELDLPALVKRFA